MMSPESIRAYQRFDSRGRPTVMARLEVEDNGRIINVQSLVPSGASTGSREALELRDGGNAYLGFGVMNAVRNVSEIAGAIAGLKVTDQEAIDNRMKELDGTKDKSRLGANAILAVSMAVARAGAEYMRMKPFEYIAEIYGEPIMARLPTPMMNVVNGGVHANNGLAFQEFMIVPVGARSFGEAMGMGTEVYGKLGKILNSPGVGDEGGYAPTSFSSSLGVDRVYEVLKTLTDAIVDAGYEPGVDISLAIDAAASEFFHNGEYHLDNDSRLNYRDMTNLYKDLVRKFPIVSLEDGMAEKDDAGWKHLSQERFGRYVQIVGDDVFVTNPEIFQEGIRNGIANAILVKPNQIGTLTEVFQVMRMARESNYKTVISHRSGETEDTFIADLAVGTEAGQIKTGAPARGERTAKYNRLLDLEEIELPRVVGSKPEYAGHFPFKR